ncbi:MAG: hypothetical protein Q9166_000019 [cf. Caloplaca sp. 2 TL-2023]
MPLPWDWREEIYSEEDIQETFRDGFPKSDYFTPDGKESVKELLKLQDKLLERDKIWGDKYPEDMLHRTINKLEEERKKNGLAPNAGEKLLDEDENWELENCQRQRRLWRFGGDWAEKYGGSGP